MLSDDASEPTVAEAAHGAPVVFHGHQSGTRWSGIVTLERGSRLRLVAPNHFRLSYGRARDVRPRVVLMMDGLPGLEAWMNWWCFFFFPLSDLQGTWKFFEVFIL